MDALHELTNLGEFPRPFYDTPLIAGDITLTHPLSQLPSYEQLQQFMRSSGLSEKLRDIGHTWFWHYEVFEWLFLERVISESKETVSLDETAFNKVFYRACAEISRSWFRTRRITVLNGLPKLSRTIALSAGTSLSPVDFSNSHLELLKWLGWRFQDSNRKVSSDIGPDDCFLIQERVISKANEGRELLDSREQLSSQAEAVIKSLKLSLNTPIYPKAIYSSYLSSFPLLPRSHIELAEFSDISAQVKTHITKAEIQSIQSYFHFLEHSRPQTTTESAFFDTALNRFADSFRVRHLEQSIVDLVVALEAMLGVSEEELKRRLATHAAFLVGTNDSERNIIYRRVSSGYELRNSIVHGGGKQTKKMTKALKRFFPELEGKSSKQGTPNIRKAVEELQRIVRLALRAYIYMRINKTRTEWPKADDFEYLPFHPSKRRLIQKQLGIKRSPAKQPDITYRQILR